MRKRKRQFGKVCCHGFAGCDCRGFCSATSKDKSTRKQERLIPVRVKTTANDENRKDHKSHNNCCNWQP
ncbi:hypothetical protein RRG08_056252 [Elysia crispata]|uniref:Uncharacterized protein n=1 Tax=Elysia crispata TaxID=231223 RepID=A0AAE1AWB8_9GAST|nr:hypothetical protein RRG08_056252 [Elysia crispata]